MHIETSTLIGSIGVSLLLLAFFLNLFGLISQKKYPYILLNILGAALAGYASWMIDFMPFVVLEGIWTLVSVFGLVRILRQ
jgi:hypothetical protein